MKRSRAGVRGKGTGRQPPASERTIAFISELTRRLRTRTELVRRCRKSPTMRNIHRLRVESRRLLARLELLAEFLPAWVGQAGGRAVRKQLKALGELRDLQVHARRIDALLPMHPELQVFRRHLRVQTRRAAAEVRRKLARRKSSRRLRDLAVELAAIPEAAGLGPGAIQRPLRQARGEVVRRTVTADGVDELHRLRLAIKRCRYLTEALQPVLPASAADQLARLRGWQSCLGDLHDLAMLQEQLREFADKNEVAGRYAGVRRLLAGRRRRLGAKHAAFSQLLRQFDGDTAAAPFAHSVVRRPGK